MTYIPPRYGTISAQDAGSTVSIGSSGKANKVQITAFDTDGLSAGGVTPDQANNHLTVNVSGDYDIDVAISAKSVGGGGAIKVGLSVWLNNGATEITNCHTHRNLAGGGGDEGSLNLQGDARLAKGDTVEIWGWNETNGDDFVIDDITLRIVGKKDVA
jgi:hypothetical protein